MLDKPKCDLRKGREREREKKKDRQTREGKIMLWWLVFSLLLFHFLHIYIRHFLRYFTELRLKRVNEFFFGSETKDESLIFSLPKGEIKERKKKERERKKKCK